MWSTIFPSVTQEGIGLKVKSSMLSFPWLFLSSNCNIQQYITWNKNVIAITFFSLSKWTIDIPRQDLHSMSLFVSIFISLGTNKPNKKSHGAKRGKNLMFWSWSQPVLPINSNFPHQNYTGRQRTDWLWVCGITLVQWCYVKSSTQMVHICMLLKIA